MNACAILGLAITLGGPEYATLVEPSTLARVTVSDCQIQFCDTTDDTGFTVFRLGGSCLGPPGLPEKTRFRKIRFHAPTTEMNKFHDRVSKYVDANDEILIETNSAVAKLKFLTPNAGKPRMAQLEFVDPSPRTATFLLLGAVELPNVIAALNDAIVNGYTIERILGAAFGGEQVAIFFETGALGIQLRTGYTHNQSWDFKAEPCGPSSEIDCLASLLCRSARHMSGGIIEDLLLQIYAESPSTNRVPYGKCDN
ncbi:MAG: hypothetical protein H6985_05085 [Pseudomonadales bacterium]|nr:hypothetical protein [Pseudomonadales bacterium]